MFIYDFSTDNRYRSGRCTWVWRLKSKMACFVCQKHIVLAGATTCPVCQHGLVHVESLPRAGSNRWRPVTAFYRHKFRNSTMHFPRI